MSSEKTATERLRELLDERGEFYKTSGNKTWWGRPIDAQTGKPINVFHNQAQPMGEDRLLVELQLATPERAVAATLGNERLAFLEEKVKRQGEYIVKLEKEKRALFAQNCEAATLHAGQMDRMQRKLEAATLGNDGAERSKNGVAELRAENARLRELVRDIWREGAFEPGACYVDESDRLEERTRELGIEVDHGN